MSNSIRTLLETHGPCLTSELIARMSEQGISSSAARQRITRARSEYKRLAGLRFAKNARFIYLEEHFGDAQFWAAMERAFASSGKSYWGAVVGLKAKGGRCPKSLFPIICGAPLSRTGQLSPDRILERLSAINLLEEVQDEKLGQPYVEFRPHSYFAQSAAETNAVLMAEFVALQGIKDWARRIGFGSYGKFRVRDETELPVVSSVAWDITAPSYLRPLVSARGGTLRPGFFVCDINLNGAIDDDQVNLFLRKYDMAAAPINVAPIMPFLVAETFTSSAFDKAKAAGIGAVTLSNLFGEAVSKALQDLIKLLSDTGATAAVNPEHLARVMAELTKIEGAANNLRGALFELAIGSLVKDVEDGFVRTGYEITNYLSGRKAEIDVLLDKPDEKTSLVLECKAKTPGSKVSLAEVQKWYSDRVPLIGETLRQDRHYLDKKLVFEMWTNATFHECAWSWLNTQNRSFENYSIAWKDGAEIKRYAQKAKNGAIRKVLDEHYFKNPLTKLAAA